MSTTRFDGAGDSIHCAIGGTALTGAMAKAVIVRRNSAAWGALIGNHDSGGTAQTQLWCRDDGRVFLDPNWTTSVAALATSTWGLVGVSRASGAATPRAHIYNGSTWTHVDMINGSTGDYGSQAGGTVRFGQWQGGDDLDGWIAVAAEWTTDLSDANFQTLVSADATDWLALSPSGFWEFDVNPLVDGSTAGTADESTRTGTTLDGAQTPSFYTFGAGGGTDATVNAVPCDGTADIPAPTVSGSGSATVVAVPCAATMDIPSDIPVSAEVGVPACTLTGGLLAPMISAGGSATVTSPALDATADIPAPTVSGNVSATVTAVRLLALATIGHVTVSDGSAPVTRVLEGGFNRGDNRELIVTTDAVVSMEGGFARSANRDLVVTEVVSGDWESGFLRDSSRRLVVVIDPAAGTFPDGYDSNGALAVTETGPFTMESGFARDADGRLGVTFR